MRNAALFTLVCLLLALALTYPMANAEKSIPDINTKFGTVGPLQTPTLDLKVKAVSRVIVKINVELTPLVMDVLRSYALNINFVFEKSNAVAMTVKTSMISELRRLNIVKWVEQDVERYALGDFKNGLSTWNLDMVNTYSEPGFYQRQVDYDGNGVYVAVLDTGLVKNWRDYFLAERIASEYAKAFLAASWENSPTETPEIPGNAWERDTEGHGTHVTSTILGYSFHDTPVGGIAPLARVIPVKVLHNSGFGWSSAIAKSIYYIADLKEQVDAPIVISMSLGGPVGSQIERNAIDYAIDHGVPVVAAAGNKGNYGMDYPGAYSEVISVGACGWTEEWHPVTDGSFTFNPSWWYNKDVSDPTNVAEVYVTDFSGRNKTGQDLDILAPGSWVVGPYLNQGASRAQGEYWFLGGTSMATPHVSGIVAMMLQKNPDLIPSGIETILEDTALDISAGSALIYMPGVGHYTISWGSDATGEGLVQADAVLDALP